MSKIVKLPSGMILDVDRIVFSPKDNTRIGQTLLTIAGFPPDFAIITEGEDIDALVAAGYITELKAPPKIQS